MKASTRLFLLILFVPILSFGQGFDSGEVYDTLGREMRAEISRQAINDLKNGVLIVRLKTGSKKTEALERVTNSPNVSAKNKEKFELKIATLKKDIKKENERLIQSIKEKYSFCEVLYVADTSMHLVKEEVQSGYFLDENMNVDPTVSLNGRTFLVVYYGATGSATKNGVEGLVVLDRNLKELFDPFPHFTGITTTRKEIGKFFNRTDEIEYFKMVVERFNGRLEIFYDIE